MLLFPGFIELVKLLFWRTICICLFFEGFQTKIFVIILIGRLELMLEGRLSRCLTYKRLDDSIVVGLCRRAVRSSIGIEGSLRSIRRWIKAYERLLLLLKDKVGSKICQRILI